MKAIKLRQRVIDMSKKQKPNLHLVNFQVPSTDPNNPDGDEGLDCWTTYAVVEKARQIPRFAPVELVFETAVRYGKTEQKLVDIKPLNK